MNLKLLIIIATFTAPALGTIAIPALGLTASGTTTLVAGLAIYKLLGLTIVTQGPKIIKAKKRLLSRLGRSVSDNEISETIFQQYEKEDPAHCFRRYVCDLATGKLNEETSHAAINNLFLHFDQSKSAKFEYDVAFKFGHLVKDIKQCEEMYDCPLTGQQLDKLF